MEGYSCKISNLILALHPRSPLPQPHLKTLHLDGSDTKASASERERLVLHPPSSDVVRFVSTARRCGFKCGC